MSLPPEDTCQCRTVAASMAAELVPRLGMGHGTGAGETHTDQPNCLASVKTAVTCDEWSHFYPSLLTLKVMR